MCLALVTCVKEPSGPRPPALQAADVATAATGALLAAGDIAKCTSSGDDSTAKILDTIPGTVLALGDNAFPNGTLANYQDCYGPTWGRQKDRSFAVLGNHEYDSSTTAAGAVDYFGERQAGPRGKGYYSFDLGDWHIIVLNSNGNFVPLSAGSEQDQWLQADLAGTTKLCTLAAFHQPRFFSSSFAGFTSSGPVKIFWDRLYAAGADVVLNAQEHHYERLAPMTPDGVVDMAHGIREFNVGTGGESVAPPTAIAANSEVIGSAFGVLKLTLFPDRYTWQFIPVTGEAFTDAGSGTCHGPPGSPPPANQPPTAAAGGPYAGTEGTAVSFDGSGSSDPDGDALTYAWNFGDGSTGTGVRPTHSYADNGGYTVSLTVTDAPGASSSPATTTATIANAAPTVSVPANQTATAGRPFTLTARFSDPGVNDAPWSYAIDWGDGSPPNTGSTTSQSTPITVAHSYAAAGTNTVRVRVTDKDGGSGAGTATVTVTTTNQPPTAAFTASCTGLSCDFSDGSSDPDGSVAAWSWSFGDGGSSSSQNPSHTYGAGGTYTVRLTVTDDKGATDVTSKSVTVTAPNQPPRASFSASCSGLSCSFSDGSSDPDGRVVAWSWSFGDGSSSSSQNPSHTYGAGGTYTVRLTVTDDRGATGATSKSVTVTAPNQPPSVHAGSDVTMFPGLFSLRATFSDPGDDGPWSYTISWGDGLSSDGETSSQSSSINGTHPYLIPGQYRVRVTVTDEHGATGADELVVTVKIL